MANLNIAELATALTARQAKWIPKDNNILNLSEPKRKLMLGVQPPAGFVLPPQTASAPAAAGTAGFAPAVDWRNRNGNHVTPVKHQGGCGSCVSFCTVAVTESMASIEKGQLLDLSEADQHFCSSHGANCGGWWHDQSFDQIRTRGVGPEADFPYASAFPGGDIWSGPPTCKPIADRNNKITKITGTTTITNTTAAKNYLTDKGPLAAIMEVYTDFFGYGTGTIIMCRVGLRFTLCNHHWL